jgi:luciferase-like monooxygenase
MDVADRIRDELLSWEGVSAHAHRFGGVEFRVGKRELGHLHGDRLADLPFPRRVRDELVAAGRARPHHVLPESGWVSRTIAGPEDVDDVIALFRLSYERAAAARARSSQADM